MLLFLFPRNNLPGLISNINSNAINKFKRKIGEKGAVRPGKRFILPIFNEEMNDIIKTTKSPEDTLVLIDDVTETVKHKIKTQEGGRFFVYIFGCFIGTTREFFSDKMY